LGRQSRHNHGIDPVTNTTYAVGGFVQAARVVLACGSMEVDVSFFRFWPQAAKNERKMA
jgi:hypothetical protein